MSSKPIRTDPRIKRTHKMLFEALLALLKERGFETLSISDITTKAGLNRATFYLHYQDKYDLLSQSVRELMEEMQALFELPPHTRPPQLVEGPPEVLKVWLQQVILYADFYQIILTNDGMSRYTKELRSYFENFMLKTFQHNVKTPLEEHLLAVSSRYVSAAYLGVVEWWVENKLPITAEELANWLWQISMGSASHQLYPAS